MSDHALDTFQANRPRLHALAYRMLGERGEADDVVQEAWLRWQAADHATIDTPPAWLVTVVTRLSIDRLRQAQAARQHYVGWWLPEPVVEAMDPHASPEQVLEQVGDVSVAFLWMLERLNPEERAAFLMRQVFDYDYEDIARLLGKSEAACRQMVHRASTRIRQDKPRVKVSPDEHRELLGRFITAARNGERQAMQALLAPEATAIGDGGGKVPSIFKILRGPPRIANLYYALFRRHPGQVHYQLGWVNGEPGVLRYVGGQLESVQSFEIADGRIQAIYTVRNPDKLRGIPPALREPGAHAVTSRPA